jgi:DNA-binding MarR family transcriptional regulator
MRSKPISDLETHTGFWLRFVSNHVSQAFASKLAATGVTVAEWVILRQMYGRHDQQTASALVASTGLTKGAVSKLLDRLIAKGYVERQEREDDRRVQDIQLTPEASKLVPKLAAIADRNDDEFFAILSSSERTELKRVLRKLVSEHGLRQIPIE